MFAPPVVALVGLMRLLSSYHLATKKIPCLDVATGQTTTPAANNGVKLELFIFDVFPLAERWVCMEVDREEEFAPVKNEPGNAVDSPDTARAMLSAQGRRWLESCGAVVDGSGMCEIAPMLSYGGEGLEEYKGLMVSLPCYLSPAVDDGHDAERKRRKL